MYDCLIIGGGVIGLSLAYELAGHGASVGVVDRRDPGKEASWAGAGILPPGSANAVHPYDQLRALSHKLHSIWAEALREQTGIDTGFRKCGGIYLARSIGEAASLTALNGMLDEEGITADRITADELARFEPALGHLVESGQFKAAYSLPDERQLRNPDHLCALLTACQKRGVEVFANVQVESLDAQDLRAKRIVTSNGEMSATQFCVCSGAWTHYLLKQLGFSNGIMPIRGQMVLFNCEQPVFRHVINEGPRYLVPRDDGRVLVGSTEEEVGFDKNTTEQAIAELTSLAGAIIRELTPDRVERTWAGLRPGSFDGFPYLGSVPGLENVFVAAGHFRSGLHLSTGTAVVMSQLIRGETPEIDLSPFRVGRG